MEPREKPRDFRGIPVFGKLLGKVRPTDAQGQDITEEVNHSARVTIANWWEKVIGRVRLVDKEGTDIDVLQVEVVNNKPAEIVSDIGHIEGATGALYSIALKWACANKREKSIHLYNTHASASLYYKLSARYSDIQTSGKEDSLVAETSLAAGEDVLLQYNNEYYQLILELKNNSASATFEVNYAGKEA